MRVLTVGSGVIGTVYGARLAAGGHAVSVLRHSPRTDQVAAGGMERVTSSAAGSSAIRRD